MPTARLLIIALLLALIAGCGLAYEANLRKQVLEDPATPAAIKGRSNTTGFGSA